jgi:DNA-binding CsgD family transcriptional regulator
LPQGFYPAYANADQDYQRRSSGLLNKQIAFDLGITEATANAHMTALMRKLNVRNCTQVALVAQVVKLKDSETALR